MFKKVVPIIALLALSGCVSTKNIKITQEQIKQLNPNHVSLTAREKPDFAAMTAGKAMFALVGAVAMIAAGNEIVQENNIDDPAHYIQKQLAQEINQAYGFSIDHSAPKLVKTANEKKIASEFPESDLVLDVQTINWSFAYFPTDWDNYRVMYSAKVRLIETKTQNIIAEGFCSRVPEESETAPSHAELLSDNAARIKQELRIAADQCINEFKSNVLNIQTV